MKDFACELPRARAYVSRSTCSMTALAYLEPSISQAPAIPRRYFIEGSIDPNIMGCGLVEEEPHPSAFILNATCDLSDLLQSAMTIDTTLGPQAGTELYQELQQWSSDTSQLSSISPNSTPETCCLRSVHEKDVQL